MLTLYVNREIDGCLDLYVTSGEVYRTGGASYSYNSRGGHKIMLSTYKEEQHHKITAEQRAQKDVHDWIERYNVARIDVQYGNDMMLLYSSGDAKDEGRRRK